MLSRKGAGRIDENYPVNLLDYTFPQGGEKQDIVCFVPEKISVSEEIDGTIYDVTGVFDQAVDKSLLQQFKDIILSQEEVYGIFETNCRAVYDGFVQMQCSAFKGRSYYG